MEDSVKIEFDYFTIEENEVNDDKEAHIKQEEVLLLLRLNIYFENDTFLT